MNSSIYIFGNLGSGYTQYPDDYAIDIYQNFVKNAKAQSQIIIHRDNGLIYYGYLRKLDVESQFIGFCVLLNGLMLSRIDSLFSIFENAVSDIVARGEILSLNMRGEVFSQVINLYDHQQEIERITSIIKYGFADLEKDALKLPPVDYSIAKDEVKTFLANDNNEDIVKASWKYGFTCVLKSEDYDSQSLKSYKSMITQLSQEKDHLASEFSNLKTKYDKLVEQKKNYKKIIALCTLIAISGVALFLLKGSLDSTRNNLETTRTELEQKKNEIHRLNNVVSDLEVTLKDESSRRKRAENELSDIKEIMPILIQDVEIANVDVDGVFDTNYGESIYSSSTMYLKPKISYIGIVERDSISLDIKFYTPSGMSRGSSSPSYCSWTESLDVSVGENIQSFQGWGGPTSGHWSKGIYRFEFWYKDVCLKAKSFTVY